MKTTGSSSATILCHALMVEYDLFIAICGFMHLIEAYEAIHMAATNSGSRKNYVPPSVRRAGDK